MLGMAPKSRCTTATSPELRVGKCLPTGLAKSLGRTILDIGTLLKMLPDCQLLCFYLGKVTKVIIVLDELSTWRHQGFQYSTIDWPDRTGLLNQQSGPK